MTQTDEGNLGKHYLRISRIHELVVTRGDDAAVRCRVEKLPTGFEGLGDENVREPVLRPPEQRQCVTPLGRASTITCWPSELEIPGARMRAAKSPDPPRSETSLALSATEGFARGDGAARTLLAQAIQSPERSFANVLPNKPDFPSLASSEELKPHSVSADAVLCPGDSGGVG